MTILSLRAALCATLLTLTASAQAAVFAQATTDLQAAARAAQTDGKRLAILLTLPDCPGCVDMERHVFGARDVEQAVRRDFATVRVDISQSTPLITPAGQSTPAGTWARQIRALGTPAFVFTNGQGEILYRHVGKLAAADLIRLHRFVARGDYEHHPFQATTPHTAHSAHH